MKFKNNIRRFFNIKNVRIFSTLLVLILSLTFVNSNTVIAETKKILT